MNDVTAIDIGYGFRVVAYEAVTLNGIVFRSDIPIGPETYLAAVAPNGRVLEGESGRPYRYKSADDARLDAALLSSDKFFTEPRR